MELARVVRGWYGITQRAQPIVRLNTPSLVAALLASAHLAACGSDPVGGPGTVEAVFVSPSASEGGVHLELDGPGIGEISSADGVVFVVRSGGVVSVVAVREESGEIRLRVELDDVATLPAVRVLSVVDASNQPLTPVSDYRVEWER